MDLGELTSFRAARKNPFAFSPHRTSFIIGHLLSILIATLISPSFSFFVNPKKMAGGLGEGRFLCNHLYIQEISLKKSDIYNMFAKAK
jgi:hypothetical protein